MIINEQEEIIDIGKRVYDYFKSEDVMFYDIETTGFDKEKSIIILISGGWFLDKNTFFIRQYFAENLEEEKQILSYFKKDLENFSVWCSYNGKAFDEPFIKKRMEIHNIDFISPCVHLDLYRGIRPYHRRLGIKKCNLKSVEKYIGIERQDKIDGGMSVDLYYDFLQSKDFNIRDTIMLHNYEDVLNLPKILKLVYKIQNNQDIKRDDAITEKQLRYLKYLMKKNDINIDVNIEKMSKKAAGRIIDSILKGNIDLNRFSDIISNSY